MTPRSPVRGTRPTGSKFQGDDGNTPVVARIVVAPVRSGRPDAGKGPSSRGGAVAWTATVTAVPPVTQSAYRPTDRASVDPLPRTYPRHQPSSARRLSRDVPLHMDDPALRSVPDRGLCVDDLFHFVADQPPGGTQQVDQAAFHQPLAGSVYVPSAIDAMIFLVASGPTLGGGTPALSLVTRISPHRLRPNVKVAVSNLAPRRFLNHPDHAARPDVPDWSVQRHWYGYRVRTPLGADDRDQLLRTPCRGSCWVTCPINAPCFGRVVIKENR